MDFSIAFTWISHKNCVLFWNKFCLSVQRVGGICARKQHETDMFYTSMSYSMKTKDTIKRLVFL